MGDTERPGAEATDHDAATGASMADRRPSSTVAGGPTVTEVAPLGKVKPTAGSASAWYEGGLSDGLDPHEVGLDDKSKVRVPPVRTTEAGSQGACHRPRLVFEGTDDLVHDGVLGTAVTPWAVSDVT
jgi:hypothetical protein